MTQCSTNTVVFPQWREWAGCLICLCHLLFPTSILYLVTFTRRVDYSRVEEVGAEIAASEWVLRNGGKVKLSIFSNWTTDYHRLPSEAGAVLEGIDALGGTLIDVGLDHLGELH